MADTNNLLRFLTAEAKLPLAAAIAQAAGLQKANLVTIEDLAKTDFDTLKAASATEKAAKATLAAAKRVSIKRKRGLPETTASVPSKRSRVDPAEIKSPADVEAALVLPTSDLTEEDLEAIVLTTNRAPLLLAFAATLVKHTIPDQPPSSCLSLAQAVTTLNAQAKAANIGLANTASAEKEGWGHGQSLVKVMTRDVRVLKRWGYEWKADPKNTTKDIKTEDVDQKPSRLSHNDPSSSEDSPALLALDLEQLKRLDSPPIVSVSASTAGLTVYHADSARNYIKRPAAEIAAEREANLGHLVKALNLLFESWSVVLSSDDLDKRAWNWYVKLKDILDLRRPK
ncbi:unnamed protein product [Aureobasidium uvarum]|uniref:Impact N-terminal domain-containing protein n=1 Tax=Aureobasidium uvarum TaxID=2773716 RepID=A0A9N8PVM2_9PEZI|nr:unnamed protein product [Aureobasidium uvarum]